MSQPPETSPPPAPTSPDNLSARRRLLQWFALGAGTLATVALGIPIVGYLIGALIRRPSGEWIDVGAVKTFPERQTRMVEFEDPRTQPWDGLCRKASAYIRHVEAGEFQAFAVNCAHLGCPVSWFPASGLFMCPCHGGVYYEDGSYASGPPPRGLYEYDIRFMHAGKALTPEQFKGLDAKLQQDCMVQIDVSHVPTLHDPLRKRERGGSA
jgi:Rieske Fe-S protein